MEINAIAYLAYRGNDDAISTGWERLELVVAFKEYKKFFKTRLTKEIASTCSVVNNHLSLSQTFDSYSEYYDYCEKYINDPYLVKKEAEDMVKEYFKQKFKDESKNERSKRIEDQVNKLGAIELKVKIK